MTICKTLSLALIALLFGACSSPKAKQSTATTLMDTAASSEPVNDIPGRSINPDDAKNYIGKRQTVCGVVASASCATRSRGRPTYLNLDEPYPRQIFTALIWGEDRQKFGMPEISLKGKRVCVFGVIEEYRGVPQIVLRYADQLSEDVD